MRILHITPQTYSSDTYLSGYLSELMRSMGDTCEGHVAMFRTEKTAETEYEREHILNRPVFFLSPIYKKAVSSLLDSIVPDIVHLHGCWDGAVAEAARMAKAKGIPCVLSPHSSLEPEIIRTFFYTRRLPRMMAYQYAEVRNADAVVVSSEKERINMRKLGWNNRIAVIPDPRLHPKTSYTEVARDITAIYRKALDSACRFGSLSSKESEAVLDLMNTGCLPDKETLTDTAERCERIKALTPAEWHRICIVGIDNDMTSTYEQAFKRMQLNMPDMPGNTLERFNIRPKAPMGCIGETKLLSLDLKKQKLIDSIDNSEVRQIAAMLLNTKELISRKTITLYHLMTLYRIIRYTDYDEDKLATVCKQLRIYSFTAQIETVLDHFCHLSEGFMPIPQDKGKGAKKLITNITNIL